MKWCNSIFGLAFEYSVSFDNVTNVFNDKLFHSSEINKISSRDIEAEAAVAVELRDQWTEVDVYAS